MTKYVSIIGNGESRLGFDLTPLKTFSKAEFCSTTLFTNDLILSGSYFLSLTIQTRLSSLFLFTG